MSKVLIENTTVMKEFTAHLATPNENKRILFSGSFGAGKTFFIKEFFQKNPEYIKISLFPVDYPVANNEDILENIKFDILNALLDDFNEDLELQGEDFSALLLVQMYMLHKMDYFSLGKKVLNWITPGSAEVVDTIEGAKETLGKYEEYKAALTASEQDRVAQYFAAARSRKGSIREQDGVTELIRSFLSRLKQKFEKCSTILIIDDLDRLDPDHVFRLFNIFTAHFDSQEESNKFGFDQVILVCDIDTLRHMFYHRYGKHANFNGYIDKFYSTTPFIFNNRQFLIEKIEELLLPKIQLVQDGTSSSRVNSGTMAVYGERSDFFSIFQAMLARMIELGQLKIRNFERFSKYTVPNTHFEVRPKRSILTSRYQFLVLIHFLRQFFVGMQELKFALETCADNYDSIYTQDDNQYFKEDSFDDYLITISLPFIVDERIVFKRRRSDVKIEPIPLLNENGVQMLVYYNIDEHDEYWDSGLRYLGCKLNAEDTANVQRPNPYVFLISALKICLSKGFIGQ